MWGRCRCVIAAIASIVVGGCASDLNVREGQPSNFPTDATMDSLLGKSQGEVENEIRLPGQRAEDFRGSEIGSLILVVADNDLHAAHYAREQKIHPEGDPNAEARRPRGYVLRQKLGRKRISSV